MYKIINLEDYNPPLKNHEIYFIERWSEVLESSPLTYRKIIRPSLRAILKETIDVHQHYLNSLLYDNNIFEIFDELLICIKSNKILGTRFREDFSLIQKKIEIFLKERGEFDKCDAKKKYEKLDIPMTLIRTFSNKLENEDIISIYVQHITSELMKDEYSFSNVDKIVESLISELIYEGHHRRYLYNWGNGVFVKDPEIVFSKKINRIIELGKKNSRKFICFIKVKLPDGNEVLVNEECGNLFIADNIENCLQHILGQNQLEAEIEEKLRVFFEVGKQVAVINIEGTDEISVINTARQELRSTVKLFTLESTHRQYEPGNLADAIVYDPAGNRVVNKLYMDLLQSGLQLATNKKYIKLNLQTRLTKKFDGLDQLLQWCRVIQDSPKETSIVAMWSLFEFLFVIGGREKRDNVVEFTIPYICQFYFKNLAWNTRELLKRDRVNHEVLLKDIKAYCGAESIDEVKSEIKLQYLIYYISTNYKKVCEIYHGNMLCLRYVGIINKSIEKRGKKLWLKDDLDELKKEVERDILRAYRIRNIITHQANVSNDLLEETYEIIAFYLKLILDDLLFSLTMMSNNKLHDVVKLKKLSFEYYMMLLDGDNIRDIQAYKEMLSTKSLMI